MVTAVLSDIAIVFVWGPTSPGSRAVRLVGLSGLSHLYDVARLGLQGPGAFRFAPIVGQILAPLSLLPWIVFLWLWLVVDVGLLVWMGRRHWWVLLLFPPVVLELQAGNIHILMAAAVVASFRFPAAWALLVLTKVTPGLGMFWYAIRREWRNFGIALGATVAIAAVGLLMSPHLWAAWIESLIVSSGFPEQGYGPPRLIRLGLGALVLVWAARGTSEDGPLPIAVLLALPSIWLHSFAILAASIALWFRRSEDRAVAARDARARQTLARQLAVRER